MTSQLVKVTIDTPGPTVVIEAHADLDTVATKALALFHEAATVTVVPKMAGGVGFTTERSSDE